MKRLAIVGSYPDGRDLIPWGNEATEIWAFNEAPEKDWWQRWDVDFQLHKPEVYSSPHNYVNKNHWAWLQQDHGADKIIWMQEKDARVPNSRRYPLEDVLGLIPYCYIRSSIAAALGLAIYLEYPVIEMYGINLVSNTEYGYQANNMCFWIGFAHGHGIDLKLKAWLDEFNQPLYGWDGEVQIDRLYFEKRMQELEPDVRAAGIVFNHLKNKIDAALYAGKCDELAELSVELESIGMNAGEKEAQLTEAKRYRDHEGDIPRQEMEYHSAKAQKDGEPLKALMYHAAGKFEYVWNVWNQTGNIEARNQVKLFLDEKGKLAWKTGWQLGLMRENTRYLHEVDGRILMAGGQRTLEALGKA
jgi:hypothetical protein